MRKILARQGYEVWAKWDKDAEIYELFNDREDGAYIGFAETIPDATKVAVWWVDEQQSEARWNAS
jgi:hypothetical protein